MELDRSLTDDEMEDRFLHNVVLLDADCNPGTPLHEADCNEPDDIDPVMAALDNVDGPFTEEELSRRAELDGIEECPAAPTPAHHLDITPLVEQTAEEKETRLATIRKMASRYQPGGAAWQEEERLDSSKWIKAREELLARKAEQRRKRYAESLDRKEAEAKAAGRACRRHQSLAGMTPEERKARKAEQDRQAHRRRASKKQSGGRRADDSDLRLPDSIFEGASSQSD
ncbi:hypothetical protein NKI77_18160 [Mesorhizobium opportunistum]|uniref:Uncharacterized protein n=1 Tax=Mesorhizobium opportunistum TaxID=593909 RepID=A0ABV1YB83_9HYPH